MNVPIALFALFFWKFLKMQLRAIMSMWEWYATIFSRQSFIYASVGFSNREVTFYNK